MKRSVELLYNRGLEQIKGGNLSLGIELLNEALEISKLSELGQLKLNIDKSNKINNSDTSNISNTSDTSDTLDSSDISDVLGLCLFAQGKFSQSIEFLNKSEKHQKIINSPDFLKYIAAYNECLRMVEKGNYIKGLLMITRALKSVPNGAGFNLAGLLFYHLGLKKSALGCWRKSLQIDLGDGNGAYFIAHSNEGYLPIALEKIFWGGFCIAGKLKLL